MRKIIHKIKMQPPEFRVMVAVILAIIMTSVIGYFWMGTLSVDTLQAETTTQKAPSPFTTLVNTIKETVARSKEENPNPLTNTNTVELIDQNDLSSETDPQ